MSLEVGFNLMAHEPFVLIADGLFDGQNWVHEQVQLTIVNGAIEDIQTKSTLTKPASSYVSRNFPGCYVAPGLHDGHTHLFGSALANLKLQVAHCQSLEELETFLLGLGRLESEWFFGRGWSAQNEIPDLVILDKLFPLNPLLIMRSDGHSCLVNSRALEQLIAFAPEVAWPRKSLLTEELAFKGRQCVPLAAARLRQQVLNDKLQSLSSFGITAIQDDTSYDPRIPAFEDYSAIGDLNQQVYLWSHPDKFEARQSQFVRMQTCKLYLDGTFGSRSAALSVPYRDSGDCGQLNYSDQQVREWIEANPDVQWAFHCIGDETISQVLRVYESFEPAMQKRFKPWRFEHCLAIKKRDSERLSDSRLRDQFIASIQPVSWIEDREYRETALPETDSILFYPYSKLAKMGLRTCFGTDHPISPIDPASTIQSWLQYCDDTGDPRGFWDKLGYALQSYSLECFRVIGETDKMGSIKTGHCADLVVFEPPDSKLNRDFDWRVQQTIFRGNVVFEA